MKVHPYLHLSSLEMLKWGVKVLSPSTWIWIQVTGIIYMKEDDRVGLGREGL